MMKRENAVLLLLVSALGGLVALDMWARRQREARIRASLPELSVTIGPAEIIS